MKIKCFRPDGQVRAVWSDAEGDSLRARGFVPRRASRVEAVADGPREGMFYVDFSPLADLTGDDRYRVCLPRVFGSHGEAVAAEVAWLTANYVFGDPHVEIE